MEHLIDLIKEELKEGIPLFKSLSLLWMVLLTLELNP